MYIKYVIRDYFVLFNGQSRIISLNLKRLGGQFNTPCDFSKNASSKERMKPCFFLTLNIIVSRIFPENFIEFFKSFKSYKEVLCQY